MWNNQFLEIVGESLVIREKSMIKRQKTVSTRNALNFQTNFNDQIVLWTQVCVFRANWEITRLGASWLGLFPHRFFYTSYDTLCKRSCLVWRSNFSFKFSYTSNVLSSKEKVFEVTCNYYEDLCQDGATYT